MPAIKMIEAEEATDDVRAIYDDIKGTLGIDFVPNMYKLMAPNPAYLEANWHKVRAVMVEPGELDRLTKEIIAVAVSATNSCRDSVAPSTTAAAKCHFFMSSSLPPASDTVKPPMNVPERQGLGGKVTSAESELPA
jgi:alkylhydroperoxidase family enzyme